MVKAHIGGYQGYIPQRKFGSIEPRPAENPTADIQNTEIPDEISCQHILPIQDLQLKC